MYAWNEEMEKGIERATLWEDSPETLALHRREYNDFMQQYLSLQGDSAPSHTTAAAAAAAQALSTIQKSLFIENLLIAADNPIYTFRDSCQICPGDCGIGANELFRTSRRQVWEYGDI